MKSDYRSIRGMVIGGAYFTAGTRFAAVADAGTVGLRIANDGTNGKAIKIRASSGSDFDLDIFEGGTASGTGSPLTAFNFNREANRTATGTVSFDPVFGTATGTNIHSASYVASDKARIFAADDAELRLDSGKEYLIQMTNKAGVAKTLGLNVEFYET